MDKMKIIAEGPAGKILMDENGIRYFEFKCSTPFVDLMQEFFPPKEKKINL